MRQAPFSHIENYRRDGRFGLAPNEPGSGVWEIPHPPTATRLLVIASSSHGWDHVSVSTKKRCPNWQEMDFICRQFFADDEAVMQIHPPRSQWVNNHPHCLHLWRPIDGEIPLPPPVLVGVRGITPEQIAKMTRAEMLAIFLGAQSEMDEVTG